MDETAAATQAQLDAEWNAALIAALGALPDVGPDNMARAWLYQTFIENITKLARPTPSGCGPIGETDT